MLCVQQKSFLLLPEDVARLDFPTCLKARFGHVTEF